MFFRPINNRCGRIILGFFFLFSFPGYYTFNDGFLKAKIYHTKAREIKHYNTSSSVLSDQTFFELIDQPFYYLDQGCQAFVFESKDRKYVLKLTKSISWIKLLEFICPSKALKKKDALFLGLNSLFLSQNFFFEESQLFHIAIFDQSLKKKLKLIDRLGFTHMCDVSLCAFSIQKKGVPLGEALKAYKVKNNLNEAENLLISLFDIIQKERTLGLIDKDANVLKNYGCVNKQAFLIDTSGLMPTQKATHYDRQIKKIKKTLLPWLSIHIPELMQLAEKLVDETEKASFHNPKILS